LAGHSELVALDEIIKNRRALNMPVDESILSELYLYNIDLTQGFKAGAIITKPRCEHCAYLTNGVHCIGHN